VQAATVTEGTLIEQVPVVVVVVVVEPATQVFVVQFAVYPVLQPHVPLFGVPEPIFSVKSPPGPMHNELTGAQRFFTRAQSQPSGWNRVSPALT